ncbi:MAG TPA: shikimate dehydrogenase [Firmicutes bacterium]|nr:shikimate dehydrogenase [Candidatus Fermentithermobacillaceae bacterium]
MGTFGFIIHPIDVSDVARKYPIARHLPGRLVETLISHMPPLKVSQITGVKSQYGEAEGWFVSVPLVPRLMLSLPEKRVLGKIIDACNKAADLGAKVVGLGAFTSVVGDAGVTIRRNVDVAVTTGNSYTVATAIEATEKAARLMEINMDEANVLVLGASGAIGRAVSLIMADEGRHLTLCARDMGRLERVAETIVSETGMVPRLTRDVSAAVREADVVVCVSSAIDAIIEPDDLRPGALVCDVSRPRNVSVEVKKKRNDVLIIEGGVVKVPGDVDFHFNFGFPPKTSYACMAETMLLALEENYSDWSLGREMPVGKVKAIAELAKKHGFEVAGFRSFEKPVTDEEIERIKENAKRRLKGRT